MLMAMGSPDGPERYDAVIIGAGVIGSAAAFELAQRGHRTLSVDKLPAAGFGSTSNSCAIVRFSYSTHEGVAMSYEGLHYWLDWPRYLGVDDPRGLIGFNQCGTMLVKREGGHHEKVVPLLHRLGIPYEDWDVATMIERAPILDPGAYGPPKRPEDDAFWDEPDSQILGGIFTPESGYVSDPQLSAHNLQVAAESCGGEFRFGAAVVSVDREADRVQGVTLSDGTVIRAPVVVNVAGPHSYLINQMAGVYDSMNIKTRALRHEVHHVPAPAGYDWERRGFHVQDGDTGVYFRPEVGNNILIGSEDPECDPREWVDPDHFDRRVSDAQYRAQVLRTARRIPSLPVPDDRKGVVDLYDVSDDWIPVYDRTDLDGFYVAIGTSGNQFKNAGVAGHCMAELIEACQAGHDHDRDPLVVRGRYTDFELNLGFYSRNREVNPDSSMSVNG